MGVGKVIWDLWQMINYLKIYVVVIGSTEIQWLN